MNGTTIRSTSTSMTPLSGYLNCRFTARDTAVAIYSRHEGTNKLSTVVTNSSPVDERGLRCGGFAERQGYKLETPSRRSDRDIYTVHRISQRKPDPSSRAVIFGSSKWRLFYTYTIRNASYFSSSMPTEVLHRQPMPMSNLNPSHKVQVLLPMSSSSWAECTTSSGHPRTLKI